MAAFKNLRDVCNNFETNLKGLNTELFSAKVGENFEDCLAKKLRDVNLFKSKLSLLRAKLVANEPQQEEQVFDEQKTLTDYEETVSNKVLERQIVKFLSESHAVKALITAPSSSLDPELVERKEKIIDSLTEFRQHESELRHLEEVLTEKQDQLDAVRREWDNELGLLRDMRDSGDESMEVEPGVLHRKLKVLVDKLELMRWLVSALVTSRGGYDWLGDPHRRLRALQVARQPCTLEDFLET